MRNIHQEQARQDIQKRLDASKSRLERNQLGQFSTPIHLAGEIVSHSASLLRSTEEISFLDPAIGTGAFYSALLKARPLAQIDRAEGYEIDSHYAAEARTLWHDSPLRIHCEDFTKCVPPRLDRARFNLLICNPPYVRHHHIPGSEKRRLQGLALKSCGIRIGGLAGLYCYFLALTHPWMKPGGIACWLVPSEFMDVGYGRMVKKYLLEKVTLLRIHRFDPQDVQFKEALVSSAVIWLRNSLPSPSHTVNFTFGGTIDAPHSSRSVLRSDLGCASKWTRFPASAPKVYEHGIRLGDLFKIKRGIATGDNKFFILSAQSIRDLSLPLKMFRPILPSPRYLQSDEINADDAGLPILDRQNYVLNCRLAEAEIRELYPSLWAYLQEGKHSVSKRYLCRSRKAWYFQEDRAPAPILCSYISRRNKQNGKTFRFFLNHSDAIAANVYLLMYPKPRLSSLFEKDESLMRTVWEQLNDLGPEQLTSEGRVYGGGLYKLEPRELANVAAAGLVQHAPRLADCVEGDRISLFVD